MRRSHDPTVLCLEPDARRMDELRQAFLADGFHVREAAGPAEALPLLAERPDLLVVDLDGLTPPAAGACQCLKAHLAAHRVPMLHLSPNAVCGRDSVTEFFVEQESFPSGPLAPRDVVRQARILLQIHQAESKALEALRHWRATVDMLDAALCILDPEGRVLRCNRALADLLGQPFQAIIGRPFAMLAGPLLSRAGLALPTAEPSRHRTFEVEEGSRHWRVTLDPVQTEEGEFLGHVLAIEEATAARSEEERQQVRRLEALGLMLGCATHDLNNLLTAITGNLEMILGQVAEPSPLHDALSRVQRAAWRAADLVVQMSRGSPRTVLCLAPVNCNRLLEEITALLRPLLRDGVELRVRWDPDLWPIQADPEQLHRVILNLCKNAEDAMPDGGTLTLETANVALGHADLGAHPARHPGRFVRLRVADTGHGISRELLPKIFDPLFTTKDSGRGVGLGLAIVADIVKKHQGWIECASEVHNGTRFDIYLPSSEPSCRGS